MTTFKIVHFKVIFQGGNGLITAAANNYLRLGQRYRDGITLEHQIKRRQIKCDLPPPLVVSPMQRLYGLSTQDPCSVSERVQDGPRDLQGSFRITDPDPALSYMVAIDDSCWLVFIFFYR
jgi:hypothetical protein